MGKGLLITESSVPAQEYAPEPMYIMLKLIDNMQAEESKVAKVQKSGTSNGCK